MTTIVEAMQDRAPAQVTPREALRSLIERNQSAVGASLPSGYDVRRFSRLLLTAANTNPELFECDPRSFLAAGISAAQLGLEPNDARGLCYLVPFKDRNRGKVVQLIIGYRGMLDLARRSGMVSSITAHPVYEGDTFTYRLGLDPTLDHVPAVDADENPNQLAYVYAVARVQGDAQFVVLTRRQIDKIRDQYARSSQSPWRTHYVEMACKTALRRLCKWLPQTVEMARAIEHDEHEDRELVIAELGDLGRSIDPAVDDVIETEVVDAEAAPAPSGRRRGGPAASTPIEDAPEG